MPRAAVTVAAVVLADVVVVTVPGDVVLDVPATQVRAEPDCAVQLIVDPVLIVLLEHRGAMLPAAVQLPVELLLDTLEPELVLLVLEAHVVMVLLPDVATVHPGGA